MEERLYSLNDANFNTTALVTSGGVVAERFLYDPYGQVTTASGTPANPSADNAWIYLHQGGRWDSSTGMYNFRNRDFSPTLMRWTTNDPIGFGGGDTNTYRYVGNGPGNGLDPSGLRGDWFWYSLFGETDPSLLTMRATGAGVPAPVPPKIMSPVEVVKSLGATLGFVAGETLEQPGVIRAFGAVQVIGGGVELVGCVGSIILSGGMNIPGYIGAFNGLDNTYAGFATLWTGKYNKTITASVISGGLQSLGAPEGVSDFMGEAGNGVSGALLTKSSLSKSIKSVKDRKKNKCENR